MDRNTLLMIFLCLVFYIAYDYYIKSKYPHLGQPPAEQPKTAEQTVEGSSPKADSLDVQGQGETKPIPQTKRLSAEELTIESDTSVYRFSDLVGGIKSIRLKDYRNSNEEDSAPVELLDTPLVLQGTVALTPLKGQTGGFHTVRNGRTLTYTHNSGAWQITQAITVPEHGYKTDFAVTYKNVSDKEQELNAGLLFRETIRYVPTKGFIPGMPTERVTLAFRSDGDSDFEDAEGYCKDDDPAPAAQVTRGQVDYFGLDKHYFLGVMMPETKNYSFTMRRDGTTDDTCNVVINGFQNLGRLKPGEEAVVKYATFFGPKNRDILNEVDPNLVASIDTGIFSVIAEPLLAVIHVFKNWTGNYGLAIIMLTILLKIAFYPLMKASSASMHKMKQLNPQMAEIREKYKDDKQKQQKELMQFMSAHKINPMKGCLPMLPQLPVFFAFYQVLRTSIELRHAPFFGWIQDLSAMDPWFVTPVLMGAAMFVQQKLTPTTGMDKTQEKIMMFMPIMFTVMMLTLPSGLTLYMLTNTVIGIAQQKWLYYKLDMINSPGGTKKNG